LLDFLLKQAGDFAFPIMNGLSLSVPSELQVSAKVKRRLSPLTPDCFSLDRAWSGGILQYVLRNQGSLAKLNSTFQ
jgi:hypothetical protein